MRVDWEVHMDDVRRLYIEGGAKAQETVNFLNAKPGTNITLRQFKSKFGGMKKIQKAEWQAIAQSITTLEAEGKAWDVYFHGRQVPKHRVKRSIKRYPQNGGATAAGKNSWIEVRSYERAKEPSGNSLMAVSTLQSDSASGNQPTHCTSTSNLLAIELDATGMVQNVTATQCDVLTPSMVFGNEILTSDEARCELNADESAHALNGEIFDCTNDIWRKSFQNGNITAFSPSRALSKSPQCSTISMDWMLDEVAAFESFPFPMSPIPQFSPRSLTVRSQGITYVPFWRSEGVSRVFPQLQATDNTFPSYVAQTEVQSCFEKGILSILLSVDPELTALKGPADKLDVLMSDNILPQHYGLAISLQGTQSQGDMNQMCFIMAYLIVNRLVDDDQVRKFIDKLLSGALQLDFSVFWAASSARFHAQTLICRILESYVRAQPMQIGGRMAVRFLQDHPEQHFKLLTAANERTLRGSLGRAAMLKAIEANHLDAVRFLLEQGVEVDKIHDDRYLSHRGAGVTALKFAIEHGSKEVMSLLIKCDTNLKGARVSKESIETALDIAVKLKRTGACRALLEIGVTVDSPSLLDRTRDMSSELYQTMRENTNKRTRAVCDIIEAAEGGLEDLSKFLLTDDEFRKDEVLEEALCVSIDGRNKTATRILLRRGVDANANKYLQQADGDGRSPLMRAIRMGMDYFVYLLVQAGAILGEEEMRLEMENSRKLYLQTAVIVRDAGYNVATFGPNLLSKLIQSHLDGGQNLLSLDFFLGAGMSVDARADDGWSILQIVARADDLCAVQYLLDRGAKVNQPAAECGGRTALQAAAENCNEAMVNLLLDMGADITAPPAREKGLTVLEAVASSSSGEEQLFNKLLNKGAPVNRPNGNKLLHILISNRRKELLAVALRAGARTEDRIGPDGLPMSIYARRDVRPRWFPTPLQHAAFLHEQNAIQLLIQHGADINAAPFGHQGATTLQAAILSESLGLKTSRIVNLLLVREADVNAPPSPDFGRTAIQAAASLNPPNLPLVQRLIEVGARVHAKPAAKGGITAIQAASIAGQIQVVLLLLKHGADVNADAAPEEGRTAIEGAAEHGRLETLRLLLSRANFPVPNGFIRAIELAKENRNWEIVDLLQDAQNCLKPLTLSYDENIRI